MASVSTVEGPTVLRDYPFWKWNLTLYLMEVAFFMAGFACIDPSTVLPTFLKSLADSPAAVGVVMATRSISSLIPQLIVAQLVGHRPRLKPILVFCASLGRVPFIFFSLWLLFGSPSKPAILTAFVPIYGAFLVFDACCWAPWANILNRTVPPRTRSWFFAWMQLIAGALSLVSGRFVHWSLENLPFPRQFGALYGAAVVGMLLSAFCLMLIKETDRTDLDPLPPSIGEYLRGMGRLCREDAPFRALLMLVGFVAFFNLASSFYVLDAQESLDAPTAMVGTYVTASMIGSAIGGIVFNLVRERFGSRGAVVAVVWTTLLVPISALIAREISAVAYVAPFVLLGAVGWCGWTIPMNYLFDWRGDSRESLLQIGVINAAFSLGLFLPAVGGYIVTFASYPVLFTATFLASVPAALLVRRLPRV